MKDNLPYPQCETCKDLGDCPHVEVANDLMGTPMPPDNCPKPIEVMKHSLEKRKHHRHGISEDI